MRHPMRIRSRWSFVLGAAVASFASAQRWTEDVPQPVSYPALVFDENRGRLLHLGTGTWEWHGTGWARMEADTVPSLAAWTLEAAYDSPRRATLAIGISLYDPLRLFTLLHDGRRWSVLHPANAPVPRQGAALACDRGRRRVVLFGGQIQSPNLSVLDDTWEWDGSDWTQVPVLGPSARKHAAIAHDPVRQRVVLFGGIGNEWYQVLGDTWEYDGVQWTRRNLTGPVARQRARMVFDPATNRCLLVGGAGTNQAPVPQGDTWDFDGTAWRHRGAMAGVPAHEPFALAHDPTRQATVLLPSANTGPLAGESWTWDGQQWRRLQPQPTAPRFRTAKAFTDLDGHTHFVGREWSSGASQAWRWDGLAWTPSVFPRPIEPPYTLDPAARRLLAWDGGGVMFDWDGLQWRTTPAAGPPGRTGFAMARDPFRNEVLLFGGQAGTTVLDDTWSWNGVRWLLRQPANRPTPAFDHLMGTDPARAEVLLTGGLQSVFSYQYSTFVWNGTDWRPTPAAQVLALASSGAALLADDRHGRLLLANGWRLDAWNGNEWTPLPPAPQTATQYISPGWHGASGSLVLPIGTTMLFSDHVAFTEPLGSACGDPGPELTAVGRPRVGEPAFALDAFGPPASPLLVGLSTTNIPMPLPGGCTLQLGGPISPRLSLTSAGGFTAVPLPVPASGALVGLQLFAQAAALDSVSAAGLALSKGLRLFVGI